MTWDPLLHPLFVAIVGVAACAAVVRAFHRYPARLSPGARRMLLGLRLSAILLLALFLLNPILTTRQSVKARGEVHVLVDHSDSMNVRDAGGDRSRLGLANHLLAEWIDPLLRPRAELRYYAFDAQLRPAALDALLRESAAGGPSTNLGDALGQVRALIEPEVPAAVLVLSDGAANAGRDVASLFRNDAAQWDGPPVYALALGSAVSGFDVAVEQLSVPRQLYLREPVRIRAAVRHTGRADAGAEAVVLELLASPEGLPETTRELHRERLTFDGEAGTTVVSCEYVPDAPGRRQIRVRVSPLPGELDAANNSAAAWIDVTGERIKVLVLGSQPSPMQRMIYRALARDPRFYVLGVVLTTVRGEATLYVLSPDSADGGGRLEMESALRGGSLVERFDCIALIDPGEPLFNAVPLQGLDESVRSGKTALIVAPGPRIGETGAVPPALRELLPFEGRIGVEALSSGRLEVSREGVSHPVVGAVGSLGRLADILPRLPLPECVYRPALLRPGAVPLFVAGGAPLVVHQRVGNGGVLTLLSPDLWWWTANDLPEPMHSEGRAVAEGIVVAGVRYLVEGEAAAGTGEPALVVQTDAERYSIGDTVRIDVSATGLPEAGRPTAETIRLVLHWPDGREEPVPLLDRGPGRFAAELSAGVRGRHRLRATYQAPAGDPLAGGTAFVVEPLAAERNASGRRDDLLRLAAEGSGGAFADGRDVEWLLGQIDPSDRDLTVVRPHPLFATAPAFLLLAGVLCLEWILRRRLDLA